MSYIGKIDSIHVSADAFDHYFAIGFSSCIVAESNPIENPFILVGIPDYSTEWISSQIVPRSIKKESPVPVTVQGL